MIAWFAKNDIAANLLMIVIVLAGAWSLAFNLPQQVFPQLTRDQIQVSIKYPSASASDVEIKVSRHIENAIRELTGVEDVSSESRMGLARVFASVADDQNAQEILMKIKNTIDSINTLPPEIDNPEVSFTNEFSPVISLVVYGSTDEYVIQQAAEKIKQELILQPKLKKVVIRNQAEHEIAIEVSNQALQRYQLKLEDIAEAINTNAQDISAGNILTTGGVVIIRSLGQAYNAEQLSNVVVKHQSNGSRITLSQIANITDALAYQEIKTRFNGQPAIFIDVLQNKQQKATQLARIVKQYLAYKQTELNGDIKLAYWADHAEVLEKRLEGLAISAVYGGILVLLMLTLFLRPAVAFWVFIGVPISFMGAFLMMPILGVSINIISLFGFILVLGMVVDDAIVTGENVYTHLEHAETGLHAAVAGTKEVAQPVTLGVLTSIVAFTPLFFVDGAHGALLSQIPAVVIPVLLLSLIESKWVLPSRLKFVRLRPVQKSNSLLGLQQKFAQAFELGIAKYYKPTLQWCIKNLHSCLIIFIGFFLVAFSAVFTGENKFLFFPKISSDKVMATIVMPAGTDFSVLDEHVLSISQKAQQLQNEYLDEQGQSIIRNIVSVSGARIQDNQQGLVGQISFDLVPEELHELDISSIELEQKWRAKIGALPGVESIVIESQAAQAQQLIDFRVTGQDLVELEKVSNIIKNKLSSFQYVEDISDNYTFGQKTLLLELTPLAKTLGLSRNDLAQQVKAAFYGIEIQRVLRGDQTVKVMLRLPETERKSIVHLKRFLIHLPDNKVIPFSQLADFKIESGPEVINRYNHQRSIDITADLSNPQVDINELNKHLETFIKEVKIIFPNVDINLVGESKALGETLDSLKWGILAASIVIYAIIAIPFKSYSQPLIVMSVIPFSMIGSMGGHWLLSLNLTMMSFVGIMALVGVVVNDAVVLVEFINKQYQKSQQLQAAVLQVTSTRFRPVVLTSMTTFLGLLPIILDQSSQTEFLVPMAVSLGFGILLAPFITLVLVPVNYVLLHKFMGWWRELGGYHHIY